MGAGFRLSVCSSMAICCCKLATMDIMSGVAFCLAAAGVVEAAANFLLSWEPHLKVLVGGGSVFLCLAACLGCLGQP